MFVFFFFFLFNWTQTVVLQSIIWLTRSWQILDYVNYFPRCLESQRYPRWVAAARVSFPLENQTSANSIKQLATRKCYCSCRGCGPDIRRPGVFGHYPDTNSPALQFPTLRCKDVMISLTPRLGCMWQFPSKMKTPHSWRFWLNRYGWDLEIYI